MKRLLRFLYFLPFGLLGVFAIGTLFTSERGWSVLDLLITAAPLLHVMARRFGILLEPETPLTWFCEIFWQSTLFLPLFLFLGIALGIWMLPELHDVPHIFFIFGKLTYLIFLLLYGVILYFWMQPPLHTQLHFLDPARRMKLFRFFQVLPYRLALAQILGVLSLCILFILFAIQYLLLPRTLLLWFGTVTLIFFLASHLVQVPYLQSRLAPFMHTLLHAEGIDYAQLRSPLSLKMKLHLWFGMLAFLSISISAVWSLLQQSSSAADFARKIAWERIHTLAVAHQERMTWNPRGDPLALMKSLLEDASKREDTLFYWAPRNSSPLPVQKHDLRLPVEIRSQIRRFEQGDIAWHEKNLYGGFLRIVWEKPLGTLVVLTQPDNTWGQLNSRSKILHLVVFFLAIFFMTLSGVTHFVHEVVTPLSALESQFNAIADGRMQNPIVPQGDMDELGRLCVAFEHMRRNIAEKIATINALNVGLEQKVQQRTKDIETANRQLQSALEDLKAAQDRLVATGRMAAVGRLLAGIAHEINNPVNAVSNILAPFQEALSRLQANPAESALIVPELVTMARIVERGTKRIQQIVERVIAVRAAQNEPLIPVNLLEILKNTLELLQEPLAGVEVHIDVDATWMILARETPLEQIFTNLFVNAAHAMRNTTVRKLTVSAFSMGAGRVAVEVTDTGNGMSEDVREKIFDPFFTTKDVGEGMGLGLSIVHELVVRFGGEIEVQSRQGEGTRFRLVFLMADSSWGGST